MEVETIFSVFRNRVQKYGSRPALMVKREGSYQPISWAEWYAQVAAFGSGLRQLGIGPGDKVAILANNRPEWLVADLAILGLGAVSVPIYVTSTPDQIAFILRDAGCAAIIIEDQDQWQKIGGIKNRLTDLRAIIQIDPPEAPAHSRFLFQQVQSSGRETSRSDRSFPASWESSSPPEDICTIVYTSGTTGPPKGVLLTHENILSVIKALGAVVPADDQDTYLSFLPLCHVFERIGGFFNGIYVGVTIYFAENMESLSRNILESRPTILLTVPRLLEKIHAAVQQRVKEEPPFKQSLFNWAQRIGREAGRLTMLKRAVPPGLRFRHQIAYRMVFRKLTQALGGRVRFIVSAGAPISKEIVEFFSAAGLYVMEGYGATETTAPVSVNTLDQYRFGTVGKPLPGVEIKIDTNGEILVKGANVFQGYHNRPEDTDRSFTADGFFRTGDLGHLDIDGFLVITDRLKDILITSGGKNVAPQNIENLFKGDPLFSQVVVLGDRRPYLTMLVNLDPEEVIRKAGFLGIGPAEVSALLDDPRILSWAREKVREKNQALARFEQIKDFRIVKTPFSLEGGELTATLKVRRKVILEKCNHLIESMYPDN